MKLHFFLSNLKCIKRVQRLTTKEFDTHLVLAIGLYYIEYIHRSLSLYLYLSLCTSFKSHKNKLLFPFSIFLYSELLSTWKYSRCRTDDDQYHVQSLYTMWVLHIMYTRDISFDKNDLTKNQVDPNMVVLTVELMFINYLIRTFFCLQVQFSFANNLYIV